MFKDIKIRVENKPGSLADLGEALGRNDVNIEGLCGPCEKEEIVRILVSDALSARSALKKANIEIVEENDVLVLELEDKPGELGKVCRSLADVGVNIDFFYAASNTRIVLGVKNINEAKSALM